jgi:diguanylate cyclase (GGDEF)-like protein
MLVRFILDRLRQNLPVRLAALCLLTLAVMAAHGLLPKRHLTIFPSPPFYVGVFSEPDRHGQPLGHMVSRDPLIWECEVPVDAASAPPCGLILDLAPDDQNGADLSEYDHLLVDMSLGGSEQKVRFSFRDYLPGYSVRADVESMKFESVYIPVGEIAPGLAIDFKEFKVADWWLDHNNLPRDRTYPDFSHAVLMGIDMASGALPGRHEYTVRHIELLGEWISKENWYLGILIVWIAGTILGSVIHAVVLIRGQREESRRYHEISKRDHLTGLFNRYGATAWIEAMKKAGHSGREGLIVLDIDRFKDINDRYGHDCGDKVLRQVADLLASNVRSSDCLARWGGEEFLVYLPRLNLAAATRIAEKLRQAVEDNKFAVIPGLSVTISLGVGESKPAESFNDLFERVDQALYRAKRQGRNRVEASEAEV